MKRDLINFIATIGFVLLGGAVVLALLTAMLFVFPDLSLFGAKAVNERDTQIVYRDKALDDAFAHGKFILESNGVQIEVKMSNAGYPGEGTIVVNEAATGIAFNSLSRTLIEWRQTLYNGEVYYRIKVLEPLGIVVSNKPTTVYINLPHRTVSDSFSHDFVLENNYSTVNFSFVDNTVGQIDALKIDDLVVQSASKVFITSGKNISVNNIQINSNKTKFICQSDVLGDVAITGSDGVQTFSTQIEGRLDVTGNNNDFRGNKLGAINVKGCANDVRGEQSGDVVFENQSGSLTMKEVGKLNVTTTDADIKVGTVNGGVTMTTVNGDLDIGKISSGGINFTAGDVTIPYANASVSVDNVVGDIWVRNYGLGGIELLNIIGNVDVRSAEAGGGKIRIGFSNEASGCSVKVLGYDGNIKVTGINGRADIAVRDYENGAGLANIEAQFNRVVGTDNIIKAGAYLSGHHTYGNVDLKVSQDCNNFDLYIYGANSANSSSKYGYDDENMYIIGVDNVEKSNRIIVNSNHIYSGAVKVYMKQRLYLS